MSPHPNIVPIRHLVVHEKVDGSDSSAAVVGFTMPFIPGGSLKAARTTRIFKLKWAEQLFDVIDDLNLQYGIVHGDVRLRNQMVDPATDNLVLIDFGLAAKRTKQQYRKVGTYKPPATRAELLFGPAWGLFGPLEIKSETQLEPVAPLAPRKRDNPDVVAAIVTVHELVASNPTDDLWATDNDEGNLWNGVGIDGIVDGP